jgi:outer membrane immunogenic protein
VATLLGLNRQSVEHLEIFMKHHLILAASTVIALASGSALADGTVITGATPIGGPTLLPDASLRSTFSPPALFSGPPPSWTGPYLGVNAGYLSDGGSAVNIGAFPIGPGAYPSDIAVLSGSMTPNGSSFLGGAQFGYNYQFSDALFAGLETDIQGSTLKGNSALANGAPYGGAPLFISEFGGLTAQKSILSLGTVRGRVGFLLTPAISAFATAGLAYGQVGLSTTSTVTGIFNPTGAPVANAFGATHYSNARTGWTAGGGIEGYLSANWSAKIEYLYYDLGVTTGYTPYVASFSSLPGALLSYGASKSSTSFTGQVARLGVNYHLACAPAPIVAKY